MTKPKLNDRDFIESQITWRKNINDQWAAAFEFADGYQVEVADFGNKRKVSGPLKEALIQRVLEMAACGEHPIR